MKLIVFNLVATLIVYVHTVALGREIANSHVSTLPYRGGYTLEEHEITTGDGYLIKMRRIPNAKGMPVLLQNGNFRAPEKYYGGKVEKTLPYSLYDAGFDVWMVELINEGFFEETIILEPTELWYRMKEYLEIVTNYIFANNKLTVVYSENFQVFYSLLDGENVLEKVVINPRGRLNYIVFGEFIELEKLKTDRSLVSKIRDFVSIRPTEAYGYSASEPWKKNVLIEPDWCSTTFEPKLRQVLTDSVCPSSHLTDEQCKRLIVTLMNPEILSTIVNEIAVTGLMKEFNVSTVPQERLETIINEFLGKNEAQMFMNYIDSLVSFLKPMKPTTQSDELVDLLETFSEKFNETLRNCQKYHSNNELCNRLLVWSINPRRITQIIELVNVFQITENPEVKHGGRFYDDFGKPNTNKDYEEDDDEEDDDDDDDDEYERYGLEGAMKAKIATLEIINKHLHDLVVQLLMKLNISFNRPSEEL